MDKSFDFALTPSLPGTSRAGDNTNIPSNSNISETARVNSTFHNHCFERIFDKLSNDTPVETDFALAYEKFGISKIEFFTFSRAARVKQSNEMTPGIVSV